MSPYDFDISLDLDIARNSRRNYREDAFAVLDLAFQKMMQGYRDVPFGSVSPEEDTQRLSLFLTIYERLETVTQRVIDGNIEELEMERTRDLIRERDRFEGGGKHHDL